jgi:hypothetical protein
LMVLLIWYKINRKNPNPFELRTLIRSSHMTDIMLVYAVQQNIIQILLGLPYMQSIHLMNAHLAFTIRQHDNYRVLVFFLLRCLATLHAYLLKSSSRVCSMKWLVKQGSLFPF